MVRQEVKERHETKGRNMSRRLMESSTGANREVYTGARERWVDAGEASGICSSDSTEAECSEGYDAAHEEQRSQ
jgi:hypothetical protein